MEHTATKAVALGVASKAADRMMDIVKTVSVVIMERCAWIDVVLTVLMTSVTKQGFVWEGVSKDGLDTFVRFCSPANPYNSRIQYLQVLILYSTSQPSAFRLIQ